MRIRNTRLAFMTVHTLQFGDLNYNETDTLYVPDGLHGFEDDPVFLPIEQPATRPVVFLQSLKDPRLCFTALPVRGVDPEYHLELSANDRDALLLPDDAIGGDIECLVIVCATGPRPTANLLGPVVVNPKSRRAVQIICPGYSAQHPLLAPQPVEASCL